MYKFNKILTLSISTAIILSAIVYPASSKNDAIGMTIRANSPLLFSDLGIEQGVTPKMPLGDNPDLTGHASISLDYSNTINVSGDSWYAFGAMANYTITHKKAYCSAGGGISFQPTQFGYSSRRRDPAATNYCLQGTIGYNFHDTKGLGIELRGWTSPNMGFNGLGLGLTWRL